MKTFLPNELIALHGTYTFKVYLKGEKLYFTSYTKSEAKRKCLDYLSPLGYKI